MEENEREPYLQNVGLVPWLGLLNSVWPGPSLSTLISIDNKCTVHNVNLTTESNGYYGTLDGLYNLDLRFHIDLRT